MLKHKYREEEKKMTIDMDAFHRKIKACVGFL